MRFFAATLFLCLFTIPSQADIIHCDDRGCRPSGGAASQIGNIQNPPSESRVLGSRPAGCPSRWCGCYLAKHLGASNPRPLWLARNWAHYGRRADGPAVGAIVVWRHHVGIIKGRSEDGQWVVHSGNDGRAIRTRPRSVAQAIAFRWP